uniref:Nucleoside phosphorylase domain-containing protein n=1 Tax=Plectus sambesii TaxID=2011161 RepID=A0A914UM93_9BILA
MANLKESELKELEIEERCLRLSNPHLLPDEDDVLYHFGLTKHSTDLPVVFGDVRFVCTGGSVGRLACVAQEIATSLGITDGSDRRNLCNSDRYCMYKVGPALCVNHGMGVPSLSIMLIEVIKLLHHARCKNVTFFRIGTSGGLGLEPGTVVVSNAAVNCELKPIHVQYVLGQRTERPATLDQKLVQELLEIGSTLPFPVATGATMCADDFYEGQGRLDGAFCEYSMEDKFKYIQTLFDAGVRNIEMESVCFASMMTRADVRGAIVCATIVNRFDGDQVAIDKATIKQFETRPMDLVIAYIKRHWKKPEVSAS